MKQFQAFLPLSVEKAGRLNHLGKQLLAGGTRQNQDLEGVRFGKLVVIGLAEKLNGRVRYLCECDCGNKHIVQVGNLMNNHTRSCGCLMKKWLREKGNRGNTRHRMSQSPEHRCWMSMRRRCNDSRCDCYANYGGRGIAVCARWQNSFENFYVDMGNRPPGMSLDRINVNGNYEPGNCRWATAKQQIINRRPMKRIEDFSDEELLQEMKRRKL